MNKNYFYKNIIFFLKRTFSKRFFYKYFTLLNKISLIMMGGAVTRDHLFLNKVKKILSSESVIFDVGAASGQFIGFFDEVDYKINIFGFEPSRTYKSLIKKKFKNSVKIFNIALSDYEGRAKMYHSSKSKGNAHSSLYKDVIKEFHNKNVYDETIEVSKLDSFCSINKIKKIHFLKIDVEGNEFKILNGSKNLLKKGQIDIIKLEYNKMNIYSKALIYELFSYKNYSVYQMLHSGQLVLLTKEITNSHNMFLRQEIIMIKKDFPKKKIDYLVKV